MYSVISNISSFLYDWYFVIYTSIAVIHVKSKANGGERLELVIVPWISRFVNSSGFCISKIILCYVSWSYSQKIIESHLESDTAHQSPQKKLVKRFKIVHQGNIAIQSHPVCIIYYL